MTKEQILGEELIKKMKETEESGEYFGKLDRYAFDELSDFEKMIFYIGHLEYKLERANDEAELYKERIKIQQQKIYSVKAAVKVLFEL